MATNNIEIDGLSFAYPNACRPALDAVNLMIPSGNLVMIMGASGAGKSTLVNTLNGLVPRFIRGELKGSIRIGAADPVTQGTEGMFGIVGLVFQDFETQLFSTRVDLEIAFGMENAGMLRSAMQEEVKNLVMLVGLRGLEAQAPANLSGGQKQRLAIGAALAGFPRVLCLDEPTTDLDPLGKAGIFSLLRRLRQQTRQQGSGPETVLIIEHEIEEAAIADSIVVLDHGRIVASGAPSEILPQVSLFEELGLLPLPVCAYFSRLGFSADKLPLTLEAAVDFFHQSELCFDEIRLGELAAKAAKRSLAYGPEIIRTKDLTYSYEEREVLRGIDLCIKEREFVAILGANGSGKTTLVKQLNGLLRPKQGGVYLSGRDAAELSIFELGQAVGYVFQNPDQQIFCDTVAEEVSFGLRLRGMSEPEMQARVREALAAVGLDGCEAEDPFSLSKGDRQRVAVASVLAIKPQVLILDEPTTGLDYKDQRRMMELVKNLNEAGHTIVMITHTMWVVAEYAHRAVLVREGRIAADDDVREIFADEPTLALADVCPPQITRLGNRLGGAVLSLEELLYCTRKQGEPA
jgi:energy-coupling factor transport system ATP-binding protein